MPAAISEEILEKVREEWAINPEVSAREVARKFHKKHGKNLVHGRKIVSIVAEAKKAAPTEPFPLDDWRPWTNREESHEETLYLLQIQSKKLEEQGKGLYQHEAEWGRRIRTAISDLPLVAQQRLVMRYGERELTAHYLNQPINTAGLDAFITYKPWSPQGQQQYELAIAQGLAPLPFYVPAKELGDAVAAEQKASSAKITADAALATGKSPKKSFVDLVDSERLADMSASPEPVFLKALAANPDMFPGWSAILLTNLESPIPRFNRGTKQELVESWSMEAK